jgi:hypothetical protein
MRGGAMRTTTSAAAALKASAPAKTKPINRFKTISLLSLLKTANRANGGCTIKLTAL